jgi:FkbM family methyltransferase
MDITKLNTEDKLKLLNEDILNNQVILIKNKYLKEKNNLYWVNPNYIYCKLNWPNTIDWDFRIKQDIIEEALKLDLNSCIIDCGAHTGDGAIPIAHALKYHNRNDIIVYAIEPTFDKCEFIKYLAKINKLDNIHVLNYGLSNKVDIYNPYIPNVNGPFNTGALNWVNNNDILKRINEFKNYPFSHKSMNFTTLDFLIKNKIINKKIGIIHLDAEGGESNIVEGGFNIIQKDKPYLTIEHHGSNENNRYNVFKDLNHNYIFHKRIDHNNTYKFNISNE